MGGGTIKTFCEDEWPGTQMRSRPLVIPGDKGEDLLGESYHNAARDGEDAVGSAGRGRGT